MLWFSLAKWWAGRARVKMKIQIIYLMSRYTYLLLISASSRLCWYRPVMHKNIHYVSSWGKCWMWSTGTPPSWRTWFNDENMGISYSWCVNISAMLVLNLTTFNWLQMHLICRERVHLSKINKSKYKFQLLSLYNHFSVFIKLWWIFRYTVNPWYWDHLWDVKNRS